MKSRLILWTGPRHSGKTTSAAGLAQKAETEGFHVAGLLAPSIYKNNRLTGFEALDIKTGKRSPLADIKSTSGPAKTEQFTFSKAGLEFGSNALNISSVKSVELIIVDEFGPMELAGNGWRKNVESILTDTNALLVLVVRDRLTDQIINLYRNIPHTQLDAAKPDSIKKVIKILHDLRMKK